MLVDEKKSSQYTGVVIGAIIAGIVQVGASIVLNWLTSLSLVLVILSALPAATLAFLGVFHFVRRRSQSARKSDSITNALNLWSSAQNQRGLTLGQSSLNTTLEEMGIAGTVPRLSESPVDPVNCMAEAQRRLYFMGILGRKWVILPAVRSRFISFIQRVEGRGGRVRFLLIDPQTSAFNQLRDYEGDVIKADSLGHWQMLSQEFSCLEVRLYKHPPCFRLMFIDDRFLALSRYRIGGRGQFQSKRGWEAPHLILSSDSPWSLYDAFESYFYQVWDNSRSVLELLQPQEEDDG